MQRNSIIISIAAVIVLVIVIFGMFVIHRNSVSSPTPTSSSPVVVHRISSSTIESNISASEIIIKMQTKNVTALVESKGYSEQGFYVCMEIYNPFPNTFNITPEDFKLVTSSGNYSPTFFNYECFDKSISLTPKGEVNVTYPFLIPSGAMPKFIVFELPKPIDKTFTVNFTKPVAYLSVVKFGYTSNDTELSFSSPSSYNYIQIWNGQSVKVNVTVNSLHKSLPIIIDGSNISDGFKSKLLQSLLISPGGSGTLDLLITAGNESYYGIVDVELLSFINSSWINISKAVPICAMALAESNHVQGYTYILYNFTITYKGECFFYPLPCDFVVKTNYGYFRGFSIYTGLSDCLQKEKVYKGVTISGLVAFEVPLRSILEAVYYEDSAGVKIIQLNTTQPQLYYSIITRINVVDVTNYTNINTFISPYNSLGISNENLTLYLTIENNNGVPFPIANITVCPYDIFNYMHKSFVIPSYTECKLVISVKYPNYSYYGPINVTIYSKVPHFIIIHVYNYTIDKIDAKICGYNGFKFVLFNVSITYYGPGKFCFNPRDFCVITDVGNFKYLQDDKVYFVFLRCETLYNSTTIVGYISFLISCPAKPIEVAYVEAGVLQGVANISVTPNYISKIDYINFNLIDNCPCMSGGLIESYKIVNGHVQNLYLTQSMKCCKLFLSGEIINITFVIFTTNSTKYLNFSISNITINSPFLILNMSEHCLHCYCRGYHVYKFVSLIIEVPNESYLGNITITVKSHIIKSEEPSIIQGINYYNNNTLNSMMHYLDTLYILQNIMDIKNFSKNNIIINF